MLATELLVGLRGRGFTLRLERSPDAVAGLFVMPASRLTDQDRAALRTNKPALITLLAAEAAEPAAPLRLWEPDVMLALEIFPGAQVIAHNVPVVWPPPGGWLPTQDASPLDGRPIREGDPGVPRFMTRDRTQTLILDDDPLLVLAIAYRFPCVPLRPGLTVAGTNLAWRTFAATASRADRAAARAYLQQLGGRELGQEG